MFIKMDDCLKLLVTVSVLRSNDERLYGKFENGVSAPQYSTIFETFAFIEARLSALDGDEPALSEFRIIILNYSGCFVNFFAFFVENYERTSVQLIFFL